MTLNEFLIAVASVLDIAAYWSGEEYPPYIDDDSGEPMKSAAEAARAFANGEADTHEDIQRFARNLTAFHQNLASSPVKEWFPYETSGRSVEPK